MNSITNITNLLTKKTNPQVIQNSLLQEYNTYSQLYSQFINSLKSQLHQSISNSLLPIINKYRTQYKTDLKNTIELSNSLKITTSSKLIIPNLSSIINSTLSFIPELPDVSLIHNLLTNIDLTITEKDLSNKAVKKMIQEYQDTREELENEFSEFESELDDFKQSIPKLESKILTKATKSLNKLYVAHLNYLYLVAYKKDFSNYSLSVNGKILKCKQSELFNEFMN